MRRTLLIWELLGLPFILVLGFPWHFVFEWTGGWRPAALLFPVNESIWEHMKLCFWPGLIWALIEVPAIGRRSANFVAAKAAGLLTMSVVMAAFFYAYVAAVGRSILWVNILDFALAAAAGQYVSYRILSAPALSRRAQRLGAAILAAQIVAFLTLTFLPPQVFLFQDPVTGAFGIPPG